MSSALAAEEAETDSIQHTKAPITVPDLRESETALKVQKGDFVIVPIPISNPTFDTGLVLGGAYFYPQTPEQKKVQPASLTAVAGAYTTNESLAVGAAQQSYWQANKWRFTGIGGYADFKLDLRTPEPGGSQATTKWEVEGAFVSADISRRIKGKWYGGLHARYIAFDQNFDTDLTSGDFGTEEVTKTAGLGALVNHDSRDSPFNSAAGHIFELNALFNSTSFGSDDTYQSYSASYRSYHSLRPSWVLAWEAQACTRSGRPPLWDACRVDLRGFSAVEYLGKSSASGQAEVRWQFLPRWGAVAFGGAGYARSSFSDAGNNESIPSYGIGGRFMVLKSQRINVRVDYARSKDDDAVYLSVAEAF
jgi:hypothetical protein